MKMITDRSVSRFYPDWKKFFSDDRILSDLHKYAPSMDVYYISKSGFSDYLCRKYKKQYFQYDTTSRADEVTSEMLISRLHNVQNTLVRLDGDGMTLRDGTLFSITNLLRCRWSVIKDYVSFNITSRFRTYRRLKEREKRQQTDDRKQWIQLAGLIVAMCTALLYIAVEYDSIKDFFINLL